jgi:hypothetical protein
VLSLRRRESIQKTWSTGISRNQGEIVSLACSVAGAVRGLVSRKCGGLLLADCPAGGEVSY